MQENIINKLKEIKKEFEENELKLQDPDILSNIENYKKITKKQAKIAEKYNLYMEFLKFEELKNDSLEMIKNEEDEEIIKMAKEELAISKKKLSELEIKILEVLIELDPNDDKDCMVEIKGAAGGDEANIFAGDLFRMYSKYASKNEWEIEIIDFEETERGGYSFIIFQVNGVNAYKHFKFESGVHRVQRVPQTETQGRVHTSTATVLVTPILEETNKEISIPQNELRIDTYRASGSGGQHINKTDSAVRILHLPTGIVVASQQGRSQHDNKAKAMQMLESKIQDAINRKKQEEENNTKKTLVGSGDRSEKIRTYNYNQNRITDHRVSLTLKKLDRIMQGNLEEIIEVLLASEKENAI